MNAVSRTVVTALFSLSAFTSALHAQFIAPTAEELSMTSFALAPGAPAVVLNREEIADDSLHMRGYYSRIKVLTDRGKEYANVEIPYVSSSEGIGVDSISGRTIHSDGTIVPFTGKPYDKLDAKIGSYKRVTKIFTLPSVEVGSIIEYRYKLHSDDNWYVHPNWFVQSELYLLKAHYMWRPTSRQLLTEDGKQLSSSVAWTPLLPVGTTVKQTMLQQHNIGGALAQGEIEITLDVHDIPPYPSEEYMPPINSLSYRVLFYYTAYRTVPEFWKAEGKRWSRRVDKFIGPGKEVRTTISALIQPADSDAQKLQKIYAEVMKLENTDFSRARSTTENKAEGLKETNSTDDVLKSKRGSSDQLTMLFVSMSRAAGLKAYVMWIANRNQRIFLPSYLEAGQLDDYVAIVNVDGKDVFLDPGERLCTFKQLTWRHSLTGGMRQTDGGTDLSFTPGSTYKETHVSRVADLTLDEHGVATGTATLTYTGDSAIYWRHVALRGDDTSTNTDLRTHMEQMLPGGMDVRVTQVENLNDADKPLKIKYELKGAIGNPTGKRLLVPANLFEVNSKPKFLQATREIAVDLQFPLSVQDAVRIKLPETFAIESIPTSAKDNLANVAAFSTSSSQAGSAITLYRNFTMGKTIFLPDEYPGLRGFYGKVEAKDQETLILARTVAAAKAAGTQ